jgi:5-methyltetrahydrofolate--homocysteine methyltransferase
LEQFPIIVNKLKSVGLRNKVKVIVGGATVTDNYARSAGVDAFVKTAVEGVEICKIWVK